MTRVIVDIYNFRDIIEGSRFDCCEYVENLLSNIVSIYDLKIVKKLSHEFENPWGLTFGYILSESHIILSTYLENNRASLSFESCKDLEINKLKNFFKTLDFCYKIFIMET